MPGLENWGVECGSSFFSEKGRPQVSLSCVALCNDISCIFSLTYRHVYIHCTRIVSKSYSAAKEKHHMLD